ncbi:MAG: GNAT family N-acetyltransferase [Caldilineales bacterium]|nr:GNAT family N-acetyltransferase [Caldilineales bacterium]
MTSATVITSPASVHRNESGFDVLHSEWNELLAASRFNSLFLTWEWQTTWWQSLGEGELLTLAFRDASGKLIGVAPFHCTYENGRRIIRLTGSVEIADYLDVIIARGREAEVYAGMLDFLASSDAPAWDDVDLCNLHESSLAHQLLPDLALAMGLKVDIVQEDVAPVLTLPASFDDYLDSLDKKQRHEIRRKRNKLEREAKDWRWFTVEGGADLDVWVERFLELHQMASTAKEDFMTSEMASFFHRIARMAAAQGWLSLSFIEIEGELAATMLNFDYDNRIWVYNSGYNPSAYGALSPGIVLNSYLIEDAIVRGRREFDFLQGNEVYKYRFGAVDAKVMRVSLSP